MGALHRIDRRQRSHLEARGSYPAKNQLDRLPVPAQSLLLCLQADESRARRIAAGPHACRGHYKRRDVRGLPQSELLEISFQIDTADRFPPLLVHDCDELLELRMLQLRRQLRIPRSHGAQYRGHSFGLRPP